METKVRSRGVLFTFGKLYDCCITNDFVYLYSEKRWYEKSDFFTKKEWREYILNNIINKKSE